MQESAPPTRSQRNDTDATMEELNHLQSNSDPIVLLTSLNDNSPEQQYEEQQLRLVFTNNYKGSLSKGAALLTVAPGDTKYDLSKTPTHNQQQQVLQNVLAPSVTIQSSKIVRNLRELRDALNEYFEEGVYETKQENALILEPPLKKDMSNYSRSDTTQTASMEEMRRFELFREVITHEDDLLNQRVSWIILAQSFLMAAYITAGMEPDSLRFITAAVGLATVFVTLPAIYAAGRNVEVQQQVYFRQIESDERCEILHGHSRDLSFKPDEHEENERMLYGHILPNMAFRSRSAVKILWTATLLAAVQLFGWIFLLIAVVYSWE